MRHNIQTSRGLHLALVAAGALIISGPLAAENADDEVIIESTAPSTMVRKSLGATDRVYSITRRVSYADLDLITHEGVRTLESRINDTAARICMKLSRVVPQAGHDQFRCVQDAVRDAMKQAQKVIAAAEQRARVATASG